MAGKNWQKAVDQINNSSNSLVSVNWNTFGNAEISIVYDLGQTAEFEIRADNPKHFTDALAELYEEYDPEKEARHIYTEEGTNDPEFLKYWRNAANSVKETLKTFSEEVSAALQDYNYANYDDLYLYSPDFDQIFEVFEGSGTNLLEEDIQEGYVDYIYYNQYKVEPDGEMIEVDGGMILLEELFRDKYSCTEDCLPVVFEMAGALDGKEMEYTVMPDFEENRETYLKNILQERESRAISYDGKKDWKEYFADILEHNGCNVTWDNAYAEIGFYSDAGEDFSFTVWGNTPKDFSNKLYSYYQDFNPDEHAVMWYGSDRGEPESLRTLLDDAEAIKRNLDTLSKAIGKAEQNYTNYHEQNKAIDRPVSLSGKKDQSLETSAGLDAHGSSPDRKQETEL